MQYVHWIWEHIHHADIYLGGYARAHQVLGYVLLCLIVFCETGLVVMPFLPGDSLLFTVGALCAAPDAPFNIFLIIILLCISANCGDLLNYAIGFRAGPRVFSRPDSLMLNKKHLIDAQQFYERHGRKTIVIARFVPIIRTFAPFVAGVGKMPFSRFVGFSVGGGMLWVILITTAGYFFGNYQFVHDHFEVMVLAVVAISLIPFIFHAFNSAKKKMHPGFPVITTPESQTTPTEFPTE
jgi:membrane-associated protein